MRLVTCTGCGNLMLQRGTGRWCDECIAGFEANDAELNEGHGRISGFRGLSADERTVTFVLSMRQVLENDRAGCEDAVRVALREGARAVTEHHEVPLAAEIGTLEKAADAAAGGLDPVKKERLLTDCDRTLTQPLRARAARNGTVDGNPPERREEERDVHLARRRELGLYDRG